MGLALAHHPDKVCDVPRRRALGQNRITYSANRAPDTQHATFGATNTAVKQTDWSPVAPFCGEGVAHLRHKPTKSAEIHGGALIPSNSTPRPSGALRAAALLFDSCHSIAVDRKTQNTRPHRNPVGGNKHGYFALGHQREAATSHVKTGRTDRGPGGPGQGTQQTSQTLGGD